jgi:Uma2 family endonuclease
MAGTSALPAALSTVAELLEHLGDIPPQRILLRPTPGEATEEDVVRVNDRDGRLCELIHGVLVEKAVGIFKSRLGVVLGFFLEKFQESSELGFTLGPSATLRIRPGQIRMPDVSFFFWDRFPGRRLPRGAFLTGTPDLAVEVLSPSNTPREMARKIDEYFAGGTRLVWVVDPPTCEVRVYTSPRQFQRLMENDVLDGGPVLPGFTLSIRAWFDRAGRRGEPKGGQQA